MEGPFQFVTLLNELDWGGLYYIFREDLLRFHVESGDEILVIFSSIRLIEKIPYCIAFPVSPSLWQVQLSLFPGFFRFSLFMQRYFHYCWADAPWRCRLSTFCSQDAPPPRWATRSRFSPSFPSLYLVWFHCIGAFQIFIHPPLYNWECYREAQRTQLYGWLSPEAAI